MVDKQVEVTCQHFWKIKQADGPTSEGRCKKCKRVRIFNNSSPEAEYVKFRLPQR